MAIIHGSYSTSVVLACVTFWIVALKCAAMDLSEMDRLLGQAVTDAMTQARITVKEAVAIMAIDESQFRKALRGEGYRLLALNHLIKLGPLFMTHLTASLMWLVAKQRAQEILETVTTRKSA